MIGIIIQARIDSTRLPNKVLLKLQGESVLEHVIERATKVKKADKVIVATTTKNEDAKIVDICKSLNVDCFRGSDNDVLDRYYQAAKKFNFSDIIRITADCPMIDPEIVDRLIDLYQRENLDYATNAIPPTFPDGLDVEIFSIKALEKTWKEAKLKSAREHVTIYMWQNPNLFKQKSLNNNIDLSDRRWTIDNPEDYKFMKKVYDKLYPHNPNFRLKDLLEFFAANPEIEKINKGIKRNEGLEKSLRQDYETY